jgi:hypothetical protein
LAVRVQRWWVSSQRSYSALSSIWDTM